MFFERFRMKKFFVAVIALVLLTATAYGVAYFVMPVDFILDVLPGRYQDDLLAVTLTLIATEEYIDDEVRRKAREKVMEIVDELTGETCKSV